MKAKPRILFLSHSATRNGATILLLHLLRWLKENSDFQMEILVHGKGDLLEEFKAIGPTLVWRNPAFFLESLPRRWKTALRPEVEAIGLKTLLAGRQYDLLYVNTTATWPHVAQLARRSRGVLWHIHELAYGLRLNLGEERMRELFPLANRFVAVSNSVADALASDFNVPKEKIDLVNGFVLPAQHTPPQRRARRHEIRSRFGWADDVFVVGGCGGLGWRKGSDLFIQVVHQLARTKGCENMRFLWVGGGQGEDTEALRFAHDLRALGLEKRCVAVPATADVLDYYCAMDAFALTSREDPFPLVMLEAGAYGLPMVCFAGSGGGPEFAAEKVGLVAPYLDLNAFAAHLRTLQDRPEVHRELSEEAVRRVETNYNVSVQGPRLLQSIQRCMNGAA